MAAASGVAAISNFAARGYVRDLYCTLRRRPERLLRSRQQQPRPISGDLIVRCVPRGGVFALTLQHVRRTAERRRCKRRPLASNIECG